MISREQFHERVLDYLYDLLEGSEVVEMDAYLQVHPEARIELDRARNLLATAARVEFPAIRFEAPVQPAAALAAPAPTTAQTGIASRRSTTAIWIRWIVAAAALVVV